MKKIFSFPHLSTKSKLSISLSLILILAFLAINLSNYYTSRASLRRSLTQEALPGISNDIYHEIQKDLIIPIQAASLMANDTFLRDWLIEGEKDVSKIIKYLWEIKETYNFFTTFLISSNSLKYYHFKGVHKTISPGNEHDVWYYDFIDRGADYELDIDTDEASQDTLTIFINHRVNDFEGQLIGVTGVGLNMAEVGRRFNEYQERYRKNLYLVDKNGTVQIHSNLKAVERENIRKKPGISAIAGDILTNKTQPTIDSYEANGRQILLLSRYVPEFNWFLIVEHEESQGLKEIRDNLFFCLIIGLVVTILVIVINVLMVNHYQGRLEELATTDELTGIPNRRGFMRQAERDMAQAIRYGYPIAVMMIDIDHFKQFNDEWGHDTGDRVLRETAGFIVNSFRSCDLTGRIGGEEFAAILPHTGLEGARIAADRLRDLIASKDLSIKGNTCRITVSIGIASNEGDVDDLKVLMQEADKAMYEAKRKGRNRVCTTKELFANETAKV